MVSEGNLQYDVAIIGGGPGGSTTATMLKMYNPKLRVLILEKEKFPRDHIGESQLPPISAILDEMGCWDKVEAANFPIKVGATFCWGKTAELWDFEFLPISEFKDEPRPAKYVGQRVQCAFQVDRSIYDDILLRHAEEHGVEVREQTQVGEVLHEGDRVTGFKLRSGEVVTARHYIDASGHVGLLRRAMDVQMDCPTKLMNIAIWDYWNNAEWAVEIGVGGTRIQVMSVGFGWIWFIPLGPTRTSLGLVMPAEYYKKLKRPVEELYLETVRSHDLIGPLVKNATSRGKIETTKDWSFLSERTYGENWFLVGESAGFADPILSAGLTLTHTGARELAYTILELDRRELDAKWLKDHYNANQRARVHQHIRFADFWYACNGQFTDLKEHCQDIAQEAGLNVSPGAAWRWIAQGGFANDTAGQAGIGGLDLAGVKQIAQILTQREMKWQINDFNVFKLNLVNAREEQVPIYDKGRVHKATSYVKGDKQLVVTGVFEVVFNVLKDASDIETIYTRLQRIIAASQPREHVAVAMNHAMQALEVMITDGWVLTSLDKKGKRIQLSTPNEGQIIHKHVDVPKRTSTTPQG